MAQRCEVCGKGRKGHTPHLLLPQTKEEFQRIFFYKPTPEVLRAAEERTRAVGLEEEQDV